MRKRAILACTVLLLPLQAQQQKPLPTFVVSRPTIIAFYRPMTDAQAGSGSGDAEALNDFGFYADEVGPRLESAGIDFEVIDSIRFRVQIGKHVETFRSGPIEIGYYLTSPGKPPQVKYGVMTDEDLAEAASRYFGVTIPRSKPKSPGVPR